MKAPRGFGRRYFTLTAIQAYSTARTLERRHSALYRHVVIATERNEDPPDEEEPELAELTPARPCHCNHHFGHRARTRLRLYPHPFEDMPLFRTANSTTSPPS